MLKFQTRRMVAIHVAVDVAATALAWLLAYALRFHAGAVSWVLPVTKGVPDLSRYLLLLPLMAVLWPAVLYFHGLYRMKRGRSRIDELFAIVLSVLIASALTLGATLYVRVYYRFQPEVAPRWSTARRSTRLRRPRRAPARRGAVGRARLAGAPLGGRGEPDPGPRGRDR